MKVSEAIDQLEAGDTVWVKSKVTSINFEGGYIRSENTKTSIYLDGDAEISLTEPQAEKVEVPPMIDKFIKDHTDPIFEICAWSDHYGNDGRTCDDPDLSVVLDWYGNNTTEFYEAVVNGYTAKPKRWVVRRSDGDYVNDYQEATLCVGIDLTSELDVLPPFKFTDKSKAKAVATLVEGSVEEV
ncbi:hypothetical protein [Enterococcus dispar]|uniref:hypothetical protein n=1 Tax=Enterococcus dispar TaxID=44009 RepID=UPI0018A0BF3F|nr:hypothetical protein [Enterococcus dispar]